MTQCVMVVEIFLPQRNSKHPLANEGHHLVLNQVLAALYRESKQQADASLQSTDQQRQEAGLRHPK